MGCFIKGIYGSRYNEAAMLGYVQSNSLEYWKTQVKETVEKNKAKLELISVQQDIVVIDEIPYEWISEHDRTAIGRPLKIFHILLDCCVK